MTTFISNISHLVWCPDATFGWCTEGSQSRLTFLVEHVLTLTLVSVILCPCSPFCQSQTEITWSWASSTAHSNAPPSALLKEMQQTETSKSFIPTTAIVCRETEFQIRMWGCKKVFVRLTLQRQVNITGLDTSTLLVKRFLFYGLPVVQY